MKKFIFLIVLFTILNLWAKAISNRSNPKPVEKEDAAITIPEEVIF